MSEQMTSQTIRDRNAMSHTFISDTFQSLIFVLGGSFDHVTYTPFTVL